MKVIWELQENLLCIGERKELIKKEKAETICWCSNAGQALNAKHNIRFRKKVSGEINARHDNVINILLINILKQRGLISNEQKLEDRKAVMTDRDEIIVGTEHVRSESGRTKVELLARG